VYELDSLLGSMPVVLIVSYSGILGGAERALVDFATALEGATALACPQGPLAGAARAAGIRVFPLRERRLDLRATLRDRLLAAQRLAGHALETRTLVRDLAPDLVIASGMRSAIGLLLGPRPRVPIVFQHSDMLPGLLVGRIVRVVAARANLVVVPSLAVADDLDASRRPVVVAPGIDIDRFGPNGPPADPPEVLVLGALVPWKRPELALEACALARARRPDLRVRLVGAPLDRDPDQLVSRLQERASRPDLAGAVELTGAVADPRPELVRASCLLHCAPREPFGLVVLEALAAGRPVVAPAAAGPAEIVDQSCGLLYRPGDAAAAASAVVEVLSDPEHAKQMGANGRRLVRERFDRDACRARFAAALAPVIRRRPDPSIAASELAVVTVTHNSATELRALLASIGQHLPGVRVVVIDCGSEDESLTVARGCGSAVAIGLDSNVGFGRGCNVGISEVHEPVAVLLNPDVELLDDSLLRLAAEAIRGDRPERLLAPLVLCTDGSRQDSVHPRPACAADLLRSIIPPALASGRHGVRLAPWRSRAPRQVGWAVGCAILARTDTLRRLGPFDERIFLYGEDLDLGLRASETGIETWFWPSARVLHHGAHSTQGAFGGEPFELLARARHDVVARRLGARSARLDDAAQGATFASRIALKRALGRGAWRERQQLEALARVRRAVD
jgi:N-acetylglucosaminyl-diphospho-decaprenol L-rhamnosyltransferase